MRVCSGAGCLRAVADDKRLCNDCQAEYDAAHGVIADDIRVHTVTDRERYAFLYKSSRWQRVREAAIRAAPFCVMCDRALAEIMDHRIPAGVVVAQAQASGQYRADKWAGFYFRSNLQGLCRVDHYTKTEVDKTHTGPWPDAVVIEQQYQQAHKRNYSF